MRLLLDTNIIVAAEPALQTDVEPLSHMAVDFYRTLVGSGHVALVHPSTQTELLGTRGDRAEVRRVVSARYTVLEAAPAPSEKTLRTFGDPEPETNSWHDARIVEAVLVDAVDYLVSNDDRLLQRAARLGLVDRVVTLFDAIALLDVPTRVLELPAVERRKTYAIAKTDPILASLRADYDGFDAWFAKCCRQGRDAFVITGGDSAIRGIAILKQETDHPYGLPSPVLKVCTFKIGVEYRGLKYGELLLRQVFEHAYAHGVPMAYVEVFERHASLVQLLEAFGFRRVEAQTSRGELILAKDFCPGPDSASMSPLDFHVQFGPHHFMKTGVEAHAVPILPAYHQMLFPDQQRQSTLFPGLTTFGNALRKAYLCNATRRNLSPGTLLYFYRSGDLQALLSVGVVEKAVRSSDPERIRRFVGARTVYADTAIRELAENGEVLAILFRHAVAIDPPLGLDHLIKVGVLSGPPQSITRLRNLGELP